MAGVAGWGTAKSLWLGIGSRGRWPAIFSLTIGATPSIPLWPCLSPLWWSSVWITGWIKWKQNENQETAQLPRVLSIRGLEPSLAWTSACRMWDTNLSLLHPFSEKLFHSKVGCSTQTPAQATAASPLLRWARAPKVLLPSSCFGLLENDFIHAAHLCPLQCFSGSPRDPVNKP